ncbi:hypothetical protein [Botrimarina sp.]|uniref:hypothetical protein n=1 Tax=Botrimarina sp. TaxID=2795802 RepID=UPI0032F013C6
MSRCVFAAVVLVAIAACVGCGPEVGPVSGVVTLDGKPVPEAKVQFMPLPQPDHPEVTKMVGLGKTDADGRYSLTIFEGPEGAVVGENRVWISTAVEDEKNTSKLLAPERIPYAYNVQSKLTYDVPPGGTDQADFNLTSDGAPVQ